MEQATEQLPMPAVWACPHATPQFLERRGEDTNLYCPLCGSYGVEWSYGSPPSYEWHKNLWCVSQVQSRRQDRIKRVLWVHPVSHGAPPDGYFVEDAGHPGRLHRRGYEP